MYDTKQLAEALVRIRSFDEPVLSLYLDCHPARTRSPAEIQQRAKSSLKTLDDVGPEREQLVLGALRDHNPRAPVLGLFLPSNSEQPEIVPLATSLPVHDPQTGRGLARFGAPYVAPIVAVMTGEDVFAVLYADQDHWRLFEATTASIEELDIGHRSKAAKELPDRHSPRRMVPQSVAERSDAADDRLQSAQDEAQKRFYREAADRVAGAMTDRSLERLVVMGPVQGMTLAVSTLPEPLRQKLVGQIDSGLPDSDASAGQVLEHIAADLEHLRDERKAQLVTDIEERGIQGFEACLQEWQRGRLSTVVLPWRVPAGELFVEAETGYVAASPELAVRHEPNPRVERRPLDGTLVRLAADFDTRLEFVHGDLADRVQDKLSGIGGLPRW